MAPVEQTAVIRKGEKGESMRIDQAMDNFGKAVASMCTTGVPLLESKIQKWIELDNPAKVADYYCRIFDSQDPDAEFANEFAGEVDPTADNCKFYGNKTGALVYLKSKGYKIKVGTDPKWGKQMAVIAPDGKLYHSRYRWN